MSGEDWVRLKAASPVRIQWDPERDLHLQPLPHRAIQIGINGEAVSFYVNEWMRKITDITGVAHAICNLVERNELDQARARLPVERPYNSVFG